MRVTKTTYIVAIILAVLAGLAVYWYQATADSRALAGKQAVNVVVAKGDLAVGLTLGDAVAQGLVGYEAFPTASVPSDALKTVDTSNNSLVVSRAIGAGQLVLGSELADYANLNSQIQIPDGNVAISVNVDDAARVANFVAPGSQVAVYWTPTDATQSRVLLPDASVLAIGATSTVNATANQGAGAQGGNASLVTFSLTPSQAARVVLATKTGSLYLALLSKNTVVAPGTGAAADSLRSN